MNSPRLKDSCCIGHKWNNTDMLPNCWSTHRYHKRYLLF